MIGRTRLVLLMAVLVPGCIGQKLLGEVEGTQTKLQRAIRDGSKSLNCAPKETAIAEANIKFAQDALGIGEYYRGKQHAETAAYYTDRAAELTSPDRCTDKPVAKVGDLDGDGYDDEADGCPEQAEDFDSFEDDDGCPDVDNDGDGVLDAAQFVDGQWVNDDHKGDFDCRNEPEDVDGFEDEDGCPDELPEEVAKFTGVIEGILFATAKSKIRKRSFPLLDEAADVLLRYTALEVEISGHTDNRGKHDYNVELSQARADAVKDYLVSKGIDAARIKTRGAGPDEPRTSNDTKDGRAENRRIEFKVLPH